MIEQILDSNTQTIELMEPVRKHLIRDIVDNYDAIAKINSSLKALQIDSDSFNATGAWRKFIPGSPVNSKQVDNDGINDSDIVDGSDDNPTDK